MPTGTTGSGTAERAGPVLPDRLPLRGRQKHGRHSNWSASHLLSGAGSYSRAAKSAMACEIFSC